MSVHYITGSSEVINRAVISMKAGTSDRSDVREVSQSNPEKTDNQAKGGKNIGTIRRGTPTTVVSIANVNGQTAINLGATPTVGTSIHVTGASYPFSGTYGVIQASGNWAITDVKYVNCSGIGASGTYTLDAGTLDPIAQREFIIMRHTSSLAGVANTALQKGASNGSTGLHQFRGYRSRVYATGWQSFSGSVSKCDVTTTNVTLNVDDAVTEHTVILSVAGRAKAADITIPDSTGLRDPAA